VYEFRFATMALPLFSILLIILSIEALPAEIRQRRLSLVLTAICLVLTTSVLPLNYAYESVQFQHLFTYTRNYLQPEYSQLLEAVDGGRLVVPIEQGHLVEGDSPVVFGWRYGVECVNGAYNQGDPNFFDYTVHLEWEERWLVNRLTRDNLMLAGNAGYIFIRASQQMDFDTQGLTLIVDNDYGQLWQLDQDSSRAVSVTPVLLDVADATAVTEFLNILLPDGYRMVLVDIEDVTEELVAEFEYVMLDDEAKTGEYAGKTVFLLQDSAEVLPVVEEDNIIRLGLPYQSYTDQLFYHGERGDIGAWRIMDGNDDAKLNDAMLAVLQQAGDEMAEYLSRLAYSPAEYQYEDSTIELTAPPGFVLVKDSYFPYWQTNQGDIVTTSQGFMLVNSQDADTILEYRKPIVNTVASMVTVVSLAAAIFFLIATAIRKKRRRP
jgi:hypothetical protein